MDAKDSEKFLKDSKWLLMETMRKWNSDPNSLNLWVPTYEFGAFGIKAVSKVEANIVG